MVGVVRPIVTIGREVGVGGVVGELFDEGVLVLRFGVVLGGAIGEGLSNQ